MGKVCPTREAAPVTMVIPAYNAVRYLGQVLDSIEAQTLAPAEVIVVDDGSRDETPYLLERRKAASPLALRIITQANQGPSTARNTGIAAAKTPFVGLLDADDFLYPTFLEETCALTSDAYGFDLIFTDRDVINEAGQRSGKLDLDHPRFREIPVRPLPGGAKTFAVCPLRYLLPGNLIPAGGVLLRRTAWEDVGGYDPDLDHAEDRMLYLRLSKLDGGFAFLDKPLSTYRRHGASLTAANNHVRMALGSERLLEKMLANASAWRLSGEETQWVRDALRDARSETARAVRYGADPSEWRAVALLRGRGELSAPAAVRVLAGYALRRLWHRMGGA